MGNCDGPPELETHLSLCLENSALQKVEDGIFGQAGLQKRKTAVTKRWRICFPDHWASLPAFGEPRRSALETTVTRLLRRAETSFEYGAPEMRFHSVSHGNKLPRGALFPTTTKEPISRRTFRSKWIPC